MESIIDQPIVANSQLNGNSENSQNHISDGALHLKSEGASRMHLEVSQLRLLLTVNSRLRLETLSALSKVFREHSVVITDELLASLVFAISAELPGESPSLKAPMKSVLASLRAEEFQMEPSSPWEPSAPWEPTSSRTGSKKLST